MGSAIAAVLAVIKAIPILDSWFRALIAGWVQMQTAETLSAISDAAALGAHAQTDADRYAASDAWQKALSRPRVQG